MFHIYFILGDIYIYIYIYRERERERERKKLGADIYLKNNSGPFYKHGLILIQAWINNHIHYNLWVKLFIHSKFQRGNRWSLGMNE